MNSRSKGFSVFLIAVLAVSSLIVVFATIPFGLAQSGTNVNGIIYSNATWTQANSPYTFTGPVAVNKGVTLTIQAGVTVNIGTYYLQVNGTLNANATNANPINFKGGEITFYDSSSSWNGQTDTGCIIENAVLTSAISIQNASPMISYNNITSKISVSGGSPIISNNIITGGGIDTYAIATGQYPSVSLDNATISDNCITGCSTGIQLFAFGTSVAEGNLIMNNSDGIQFFTLFNGGSGIPTVQNNTISNNSNGISFDIIGGYSVNVVILENNIYANNYNIYSSVANNLNATYNWWGTTDQQAINQTIFDFKNDFNLGTVNFVPFLTAPNPEAPAISTPLPSLTPTSTPTQYSPARALSQSSSSSQSLTGPTPSSADSQPKFNAIEIAIFAVLIVIVALLSVIIALLLRRPQKTGSLQQTHAVAMKAKFILNALAGQSFFSKTSDKFSLLVLLTVSV